MICELHFQATCFFYNLTPDPFVTLSKKTFNKHEETIYKLGVDEVSVYVCIFNFFITAMVSSYYLV